MNGQVVTHLGFELDSNAMEVRLPQNKRLRALKAVNDLLEAHTVTYTTLEETLGFLSHCCAVVPLGRPFLRELYSLLHRLPSRKRLHLHSAAKRDLKWWTRFLTAWPSVSLIQTTRTNHDVATDASSLHGIGGITLELFSLRAPAKHRFKHINVKEMLAILHAFLLWHEHWAYGRVRLACDNSAVVEAIHKRSIKGDAIRPLQAILLIAAIFDIELTVFWLPSEENIVADAASRFDFKKLANLGFQDQLHSLRHPPPSHRATTLRQKLRSFYSTRSRHRHERNYESIQGSYELHCVVHNYRQFPASVKSLTHWLAEVMHKVKPATAKAYVSAVRSLHLHNNYDSSAFDDPRINLILEGGKKVMEKVHGASGYRSHRRFSPVSSPKYQTTGTASISKQRSAWDLPDSFDLVSLRGKPGTLHHPSRTSRESMSSSTQTAPLRSRSQLQKPIHIARAQTSTSPEPHPSSAPSEPSPHYSEHNSNNLTTPSSHLHMDHLTDLSSSAKSENFFSKQVSTHQISQDTRCAKERLFQQQHGASQKRTSSCLDDGEAMPSMFTLTNSPKKTKSKNLYN